MRILLSEDAVTSGTAIVAPLRAAGNWVPVLLASAGDTVRERIAGLDAGADDFVHKPFVLGELVARVRAVLRRHVGSACPVLQCGGLRLDPLNRSVTRDGVVVELSAKEFAVLEVLMLRPGRVLSRNRIEESVYGWGEEVGSNAVEVHLHYLRKKLGARPSGTCGVWATASPKAGGGFRARVSGEGRGGVRGGILLGQDKVQGPQENVCFAQLRAELRARKHLGAASCECCGAECHAGWLNQRLSPGQSMCHGRPSPGTRARVRGPVG